MADHLLFRDFGRLRAEGALSRRLGPPRKGLGERKAGRRGRRNTLPESVGGSDRGGRRSGRTPLSPTPRSGRPTQRADDGKRTRENHPAGRAQAAGRGAIRAAPREATPRTIPQREKAPQRSRRMAACGFHSKKRASRPAPSQQSSALPNQSLRLITIFPTTLRPRGAAVRPIARPTPSRFPAGPGFRRGHRVRPGAGPRGGCRPSDRARGSPAGGYRR